MLISEAPNLGNKVICRSLFSPIQKDRLNSLHSWLTCTFVFLFFVYVKTGLAHDLAHTCCFSCRSTQEIAKLKHEVSSDTNKHDAAKKVMTMKIESLERQLQQKVNRG